MSTEYGYIIDASIFRKKMGDVTWPFVRTDENEKDVSFNGIESPRDLKDDPNIVIMGDNTAFNLWLREHKPKNFKNVNFE